MGCVVDLYSLRVTVGTLLACAGVASQVVQRIIRHSDNKTTQRHYTVLGLTDTAAAISNVAQMGTDDRKAARATGTEHATPDQKHPHYVQQLGRETVRSGAPVCDNRAPFGTSSTS